MDRKKTQQKTQQEWKGRMMLQFLCSLMWTKFYIHFFSKVENCISTISIVTFSTDFMCTSFAFLVISYSGVSHCDGYDFEESPVEIMDAHLSELFFTKRMKMLSRPDGFMIYGQRGFNFSPLLNCCIQIWKLGYDWSEADLNFTRLVTTPTLVLDLLIARFMLVVLLLMLIIRKKDWICFHTLLWSSIFEKSSKEFNHSR